jgi:radical SAM/Cys-rich protein
VSRLSLLAERHPLASPAAQKARLRSLPLAKSFDDAAGALSTKKVQVLQLNLGKKCNQACKHCHVDAGPDREEVMADAVVDRCLRLLKDSDVGVVDLTGGAPELHPRFEEIVEVAAAAGKQVMDRCNLTILTVPRYKHLPRFFADHGVEVVASLPFPEASRTDSQRGDGVFDKSVTAMKLLNAAGYGVDDRCVLTLVANPTGAFLPPSQVSWERDFRQGLLSKQGVRFTRLIALTNMPIARFLEWLDHSGNTERYLEKLVNAFNPAAAAGVMCKTTLSVSFDGRLFDCDFNQMLELPEAGGRSVFDVGSLDEFAGRRVITDVHCFGCTAGAGSSCGGQTDQRR